MAVPGPKPKPPHLRAVDSRSPKKTRERRQSGVRAKPSAPEEPTWRTLLQVRASDPLVKEASTEWRRIIPELDQMGLLAQVDNALLTDYCLCWARLIEAERLISDLGMAVKGERGFQRNPGLVAAHQYRTQLRHYIAELGLGPSSRGRIRLPGSGDDEEEDLFT